MIRDGLLGAPALSQTQRSADSRVLRFVPQANLTSLDPIWTTATVTHNHALAVYDTLYSVDSRFRPRPQMAEGHNVSDNGLTWRIGLRDGPRFHDGEPVRAQDCQTAPNIFHPTASKTFQFTRPVSAIFFSA